LNLKEDPSSRPAVSPGEARRRGRRRRWLRRSLAGLAALVALLTVALVVFLHSLDRPWLKRRIQRLARTSGGVEIDYRAARIDLLSGAGIDGLVVQSPAEVRRFAPELVRVERVEVGWSLGALLMGRRPVLGRVAVSDVTLTVVVDEHGRTSFDALSSPGPSPAPGPTEPLSHQAANLLGNAPPLGDLGVDRVTVALVRTEKGEVSERAELRGHGATLVTSSAAPAAKGWRARAGLGSASEPLDLSLTRTVGPDASAARAKLWITLDATSSALAAALDVRMLEQTFAASVSASHWIHAEASVRFDPAAGQTEIVLDHTEAGDGAATADASIEVPDAGDPIVRRARADIDLARLLRWLPPGLVPVTAEVARVRGQVDSLVVGPVVRLSDGGAVAVDADVSNAAVSLPAGPLRSCRGPRRATRPTSRRRRRETSASG